MTEVKHWMIVLFGVIACFFIGDIDHLKVSSNHGYLIEQPSPVTWVEELDSKVEYWLHHR